MRIDHIVNLGFNCSATMVARRFKLFSGCSPFDWCIVKSDGVLDMLCYLFAHSTEECTDKFMKSLENRAEGFPIHAPHFTKNDGEKIKRRFDRLLTLLQDCDKNILFTFISDYTVREDMPANKIYSDLKKICKIITLFRPKNTFKIVFVHCDDLTENGEENIEDIKLPIVQHHNHWIWPCHHHIKLRYGLEEEIVGTWT